MTHNNTPAFRDGAQMGAMFEGLRIFMEQLAAGINAGRTAVRAAHENPTGPEAREAASKRRYYAAIDHERRVGRAYVANIAGLARAELGLTEVRRQ